MEPTSQAGNPIAASTWSCVREVRLTDAGGLSMVLADSDAYLAEVSAKFLGAHGVRVTLVNDGSVVARELERNAHSCLVVATNLTKSSGLEVCKQVRASFPVLPIIVSGSGASNERVLALLAGADDYVRRPYSSRDLIERIHVIIRRRRSAFPFIAAR
jgi:DNA-binding response OmpR family regulator